MRHHLVKGYTADAPSVFLCLLLFLSLEGLLPVPLRSLFNLRYREGVGRWGGEEG
jgi:hypothetical protein